MSGARVVAYLEGDGTGFERMLKGAASQAENFSNNVVGGLKGKLAGLFTLGAIEEGIRSVINFSAHIKDMARQTGLTTDEVQRIGYAARASGLEFEDFETALSRMGTARKDAAESNDQLLRTFHRYGITLADLQNPAIRNVDLLYKMSAAIRDVNLSAGQREELREFFGKSGDKLAEAISKLNDFKDKPLVSKEDIDAIDRLQKSIDRLIVAAKVLASGPVAEAANNISNVLDPKKSITEKIIALGNLTDQISGVGWLRKQIAAGLGLKPIPTNGSTSAIPIAESQPGAAGGLFEDQRQTEALKLQDRLREISYQNALKLLTPEERRVSLLKEINSLLNAGNVMAQLNPNDQRAALAFRIKAEEKIGELEGIRPPKIPNDSATRVGNFIGSGVGNIPAIQEKIVRENTNALRDVNRGLAALGAAIKSVTGFNPLGAKQMGIPPI